MFVMLSTFRKRITTVEDFQDLVRIPLYQIELSLGGYSNILNVSHPTVFIMKLGLIQTRPTWQTCKKPPGHKHNLENSKAHLWQFQSYWFLEANLRKPIFCYVEQSLLPLQSILSEWVPLVPWKLLRRLSAKVLIIFLKRGSMT